MKRLHFIILCLSLIVLSMSTSCFRKEEKRIEAQWENTLLLPGCAGMPENVGLAGAYSGIVEGKLLVLGGANFPDKYIATTWIQRNGLYMMISLTVRLLMGFQ